MIKIIDAAASKEELRELAREFFSDFVKVVVDIEREIMAVGGEFHVDEESILLEKGSQQQNLWGINIYPDKSLVNRIEFDSMINVRPRQGNRTRGVDDPKLRNKIITIIDKLIHE